MTEEDAGTTIELSSIFILDQYGMDFLESLTEAVREGYCSVTGTIEGLYGNLARIPLPLGVLASAIQGGAAFANGLFCNRIPPSLSIPFTGGQCQANYNVTYTYTQNQPGFPGSPVNETVNNIPGAIKGVVVRTVGNDLRLVLLHGLPGNAAGDGETIVRAISNGVPNGFTLVSTGIVSVVRSDSSPDTCGNPPPNPVDNPDPGYNERTPTVTFDDEDGVTVNIPVGLVFGFAYADIDGSINIPFTANLDLEVPIDIDGSINLTTGDINFGSGGNGSGTGGSGTGDPNSNLPSEEPPSPPGDIPAPLPKPDTIRPEEPQEILSGVLVTLISISPGYGKVFQDANPDLYLPRLGNVQFRIRVGGIEGWTTPVEVKSGREVIPCSWEPGALEVRGTPEPGVTWTLTPLVTRRSLQRYFPS